MKFTKNYQELTKAVREVKFRILMTPFNADERLEDLRNLERIGLHVRKIEIEAGNATEFDIKEFAARQENASFEERVEYTTGQSLYFHISEVLDSIEDAITFYEKAVENEGYVYENFEKLGQVIDFLGETDVVPLSMSENPLYSAEHINSGMERILRYTDVLIESIINGNPFLKKHLSRVVADVTYEVTEVDKTSHHPFINSTKKFDERLKSLGLDNFIFTDYLKKEEGSKVDSKMESLLAKLNVTNVNPNDSLSGSNVFGTDK